MMKYRPSFKLMMMPNFVNNKDRFLDDIIEYQMIHIFPVLMTVCMVNDLLNSCKVYTFVYIIHHALGE